MRHKNSVFHALMRHVDRLLEDDVETPPDNRQDGVPMLVKIELDRRVDLIGPSRSKKHISFNEA